MRIEEVFEWREYTRADFGQRLSLVDEGGRPPKYVVMKEAGDLLAYRKDTRQPDGMAQRFLHSLPANYPHYGPTVAVDAAQTASFVAYW